MITLKDHNIKPYEELCRMLETQDKVAYVSATGTGKSYVIGKYIEEHELIKKTIILVPSLPIKRGWKKLLPQVRVYTYQAMLSDQAKVTECDLLICDEMHHLGAEEWGNACQNIFAGFDGKVIGTTATPVRFLDNQRNIADEIFEGNQVNGVDLPEAISQGVLPSFEYITALYDLPKRVKKRPNQNPYTKNLYVQLDLMSSKYSFQEILLKHLSEEKDIRVAVFVNKISELEGIKKMCQSAFPDAKHYIAHSKMKKAHIETAIKGFESSGGMCFLYTVNILNEGVHIDGVDSVIMFRKTQSPIVYLQQLGRALSSNNTEKRIKVFDFVANHCNLDSYMKTGSSVIGWITGGISNPDRQIIVADYVLEELELLEKIKVASSGMWSQEEDQVIRDYYDLGRGSAKCQKLLPHRTNKAVHARATALGLTKNLNTYTEDFYVDLKKYYPQSGGMKVLMELYPQISKELIRYQASRLGLRAPNSTRKWTQEEWRILQDNIDKPLKELEKMLPGRSVDNIQSKKRRHGLCKSKNLWTDEHDAIIMQHPKMSAEELQKEYFKDYHPMTIRKHMTALGVNIKHKWNWSDEENENFINLYSEGGYKRVQSSDKFCDMSKAQIISRARTLNVNSKRTFSSGWNKEEIEKIRDYIQNEDGNSDGYRTLIESLSNHKPASIRTKIKSIRKSMEAQNA